MRLNVIALGLAAGLLWAGAILLVALANLIWPGYGAAFLELVASIYPGYHPGTGVGSAILAAIYGLIDGIIGGVIFAWLYNAFSRKFSG